MTDEAMWVSLQKTEQEQRATVVAEARTWINTPFHTGAEVKGAGVDCSHLPHAVYLSQGLIKPIQFPAYQADWWKHAEHEEKHIVENLKPQFREVSEAECGIGDLVVVKIGRAYAHCAIVTEVRDGKPLKGINAWPLREKVWEVDIVQDAVFQGRLRRYFSPWGK